MRKAWLPIKLFKNQHGFSPVELLLAVTTFGVLVVALTGAIIYGRSATADSGDHVRANFLAEEGAEAVRNIRDNAFTNLTDGTYGLVQSGNQWILSGTSDTNGIYTRQIIISTVDTVRKQVISRVSWTTGSFTNQVDTTVRLTNWTAAIISWANAVLAGSLDAASTNDGLKVATAGNYAYVVRNDGTPDFMIINISNPAAPTLTGSLTLTGTPTNIKINGNYAFVTSSNDSIEMQIVNISNPASPSLVSSYNASGAGNGLDVAISGNYAYLVRSTNTTSSPELVVLNITNPASPTLAGSIDNNINLAEIAIIGNYAYIATDSDTQELLVVNITTPTSPSAAGSYNASGTTNATTVDGFGSTILLGQGTSLHRINVATPTAPALLNSVLMTGTGVINDIDVNTGNTFAYIGTTNTTGEFQVINIANASSMSVARVVDLTGTTSALNGVAYNSTLDVVVGASASDTLETVIFRPN